jgi:hypothetical protein
MLRERAVDFEGAVECVFGVVAAQLEEGFEAGAREAEDLVLARHAHLGRVLPLVCERVPKGRTDGRG